MVLTKSEGAVITAEVQFSTKISGGEEEVVKSFPPAKALMPQWKYTPLQVKVRRFTECEE